MPIVNANNIDIWYEAFGSKKDTPLLLIMGGCCQGMLWPSEFCQQLTEAGFFVIRYDHRDTGLSTSFDFKKQPYNLMDLTKDAIALLDNLEIQKFHLVGLSMGGPIAELLSVNYSTRTLSMTLIATSCDFRPMNLAFAGAPQEKNAFLSPPFDIYLKWMKKFASTPPKSELEHIELRLEGWRILNGNKVLFEETRYRELHKEFLRRQRNQESILNHIHVCRISEEIISSLPSRVKVPTIILHGSEDPIFPPDHGKALAEKIVNSKYIPIEGMGHVLNCQFYEEIIRNIKAVQMAA